MAKPFRDLIDSTAPSIYAYSLFCLLTVSRDRCDPSIPFEKSRCPLMSPRKMVFFFLARKFSKCKRNKTCARSENYTKSAFLSVLQENNAAFMLGPIREILRDSM